MITCHKSNQIFIEGKLQPGQLFVKGDKLVKETKADKTIDHGEALIIPRLIDLQVNGGFGIDLTTEPERVEELSVKLYETGVGAFLPTVVSSPLKNYEKILSHFKPRKVKGGAEILGAHLEGPFLSIAGAHDEKHLISKGDIPLENVRMITVAPETVMPEILFEWEDLGIIVSAGHSQASYGLLHDLEIKCVTHLFNAMPFHHRRPSLVEYALNGNCFYTLIADGKHVSYEAIEMAYRANPQGMILVSDASAQMLSSQKEFSLGGKIYKKGALAGSDETLLEGVLKTGHIKAATENPAKLLGIKKGALTEGSDADFLVIQVGT